MRVIPIHLLRITIAFLFSFSTLYAQEYKIQQIDSIVMQIKRDSHLSVKICFDSAWFNFPDGHRSYVGRVETRYYFNKVPGDLKMVRNNKMTYYYHMDSSIKVDLGRRHSSIYYDGQQIIKYNTNMYPSDALENVRRHLLLSKIYLNKYLSCK